MIFLTQFFSYTCKTYNYLFLWDFHHKILLSICIHWEIIYVLYASIWILFLFLLTCIPFGVVLCPSSGHPSYQQFPSHRLILIILLIINVDLLLAFLLSYFYGIGGTIVACLSDFLVTSTHTLFASNSLSCMVTFSSPPLTL